MKSTNKKSISAAILSALEANDTSAAVELMELWDSKVDMGIPQTLNYYYTKISVLLKCYQETKNFNAKVRYLHDAIEMGNAFFVMNELQGFPMDDKVREMWYTLVDTSAEFSSTYLDEGYEGELDEDDEESEDRRPDLLIGALRATIGEIIRPNFKES